MEEWCADRAAREAVERPNSRAQPPTWNHRDPESNPGPPSTWHHAIAAKKQHNSTKQYFAINDNGVRE